MAENETNNQDITAQEYNQHLEQQQVSEESVLNDQSTTQLAQPNVNPTEQIDELNAKSTEQIVQNEEKESSKDANFRALREKAEKAERERDQAVRILQDIERQKQQVQPQEEPEEELNIGADDLVEGKHLSHYEKKIKKLEERINKQYQQTQQQTIEQQLRAQYPDFDKVVNESTVASLRSNEPELSDSIASNGNLYSQAVAAYKAIKTYGIYKEDTFVGDKIKAQENASKPRPLASVSPQQGDSPLSNANAFANGLTEDHKKQLWAEMQELRKKH